ncbi:hypothetical protein NDU88_005851 [Pleurodeles waltl]|uniref:Peptidase A2 domain-containing protein n=1 Tax=Pleurodeles waltl TaxID=8319 RepID=A0AAV7RLD6_PLEWA|nr:hypothetical protein NDU88_005851 [Pleurodeles waltl]
METGRARTMKQAHHLAGGQNKPDRPSLLLKERHAQTCYRCGLEYPHADMCPALGHRCRKCNHDNHFASVGMNGNVKAEKNRPARLRAAESRHARHVEAQNRRSSADSDATSKKGTNERLYLMSDVSMPARTTEHVQLVDKCQMQKTATVEIQIGSHITRFVLDNGTTCTIMCLSEYEKIKSKPLLIPSTVNCSCGERGNQ